MSFYICAYGQTKTWLCPRTGVFMNNGTFRDGVLTIHGNSTDIRMDLDGRNFYMRFYIVPVQANPPRYALHTHVLGKGKWMSCKASLDTPVFSTTLGADEVFSLEYIGAWDHLLSIYSPSQDRYLTLGYSAYMGTQVFKPLPQFIDPYASYFAYGRVGGPVMEDVEYQFESQPGWFLSYHVEGAIQLVTNQSVTTRWRFERLYREGQDWVYYMKSYNNVFICFNSDNTISFDVYPGLTAEMNLFPSLFYLGLFRLDSRQTLKHLVFSPNTSPFLSRSDPLSNVRANSFRIIPVI